MVRPLQNTTMCYNYNSRQLANYDSLVITILDNCFYIYENITIYDDCYYKLRQNTDAFYEPHWWFSKDRYIYSIASSVEISSKAFCERLVSSYLNEEKQRNKMEVEGFNRWAFLEEPVFDLSPT